MTLHMLLWCHVFLQNPTVNSGWSLQGFETIIWLALSNLLTHLVLYLPALLFCWLETCNNSPDKLSGQSRIWLIVVRMDNVLLTSHSLSPGQFDGWTWFSVIHNEIFFYRALKPPGWKSQWHCGVRVATNKKLVGFISAIPAHVRIQTK